MGEASFHNSILVEVPEGRGECAFTRLRTALDGGVFHRLLAAGGTRTGTWPELRVRGTDALVLDFETPGGPVLDTALLLLAEMVAFAWDGGRGTVVHNIFTYPAGHPGAEPGKKPNEDGRAYGDIVVTVTFGEGPVVSTFSNTMRDWGVEAGA